MANINNYNRRRFLQHSVLGVAAAAFPGLIQASSRQIKSVPSADFKPIVVIEFTSKMPMFL